MSSHYRVNSSPIGRAPEPLGEMSARVNATADLTRRLDSAKYGKPTTARRFASNVTAAVYTLAPTGYVWRTDAAGVSAVTDLGFRDLMNLVASGKVREITHEAVK